MATTEKKKTANRRNAAFSTGLRTAEGKAVAARNATRHGLLAAGTVIDGEDPGEFAEVVQQLREALQPLGPLESLLVSRIADGFWRLRRLARVEAGIFEHEMSDAWMLMNTAGSEEGEHQRLGFAAMRDGNGVDAFTKLSRYEAAIECSVHKNLHELQRLQAARAGVAAPLSVAIDVAVSGVSCE